jgi:hypothetical protein
MTTEVHQGRDNMQNSQCGGIVLVTDWESDIIKEPGKISES